MDEPMMKEDIGKGSDCYTGRWNSAGQLELLVGNDNYMLVALCCFENRSQDIDRDKVE